MSVFSFDEHTGNVSLSAHPLASGLASSAAQLSKLLTQSKYDDYEKITNNINALFIESASPAASLVVARAINAELLINIDEKKMLAEATLFTAKGGTLLTMQKAITTLAAAGVVKGIDPQALESLLAKQHSHGAGTTHSKVVALGQLPKQGQDAKFVRLCQTAQDRVLSPQAIKGGRVDMKDLGEIITVKPGTQLMQRIPATLGVSGYSVCGDVLPAKPGKEHMLQSFEGTKIDSENPNLLIANCKGVPVALPRGMRVDDVLYFNNIDPSTGHVDFDGSIIVSGDIKDGMRVKATGDITVLGFVESAQLVSNSAITIVLGAIGRHREHQEAFTCSLNAQRTISIGYAQYCNIKTEHNLFIERQSLHCELSARRLIRVGKANDVRGKIIGGSILDALRIEAGEIGAPSGTKTRVHIAQHWHELRQKQLKISDFEKILATKSAALEVARKNAIKIPIAAKRQVFLDKITVNEQHIASHNKSITQKKRLIKHKMAQLLAFSRLKVNDQMHPGVELKIARDTICFSRLYPPHLVTHNEGKITQSF